MTIATKAISLMLSACLLVLGVPAALCAVPENNATAFAGETVSDAADASSSQKIQVTSLFLKWSSDYDGPNEFVGEDMPLESVDITTKGKLVQLNTYYLDSTDSGIMNEAASSSTELGVVPLVWESSDISVVTVNPYGLVTAVGNGTAKVTVSVADPGKYGEASTTVWFNVDGQEGEYVTKVEIVDEGGNPIEGTIVLEAEGSTPVYKQLYANVTWSDAEGRLLRVESTKDGKLTSDFIWETAGNTSVVYVNSKTGRIASQQPGITQVICTVEGGVAGKKVSGSAYVKVDTGQTAYNPADHLTLTVSYEDYPDQIIQSQTYSVDELAALLPQVTHNYTVIGDSRFATIRATGYLFKDVVALLNVHSDDILQFRFGTEDSYDSPVNYDYLFGSARYYYPDYDIGYTSGAEVVPPLLSTANNIHWNVSAVLPTEELDEGTRYRVVFGVSDPGDSNTSKQVYYINTINVILKGSPPIDPGSGGGQGGGEGTGGGGQSGGADNPGSTIGESGNAATEAAASSSAAASGGQGESGGKEWRIYQMLSNSKSDPGELLMDNPLAPYVLPAAVVVFVMGGVFAALSFRRRLYS